MINIKGTTVNERLWISGLMNNFDKAVEEKDVYAAISILKQVELTDENINPILKQVGLI